LLTNFYLRSHHHPSNPWLYETFNETDLSKIERYRVVTQSVCLSMSDGRLKERVIKQDVIAIELGG
jgi:hypothetical protein